MATPYQQWLKANGIAKSTKSSSKRFKAQRRNNPYTLATQVARDPLSIPYGSDLVWHGAGAPNLETLRQRGLTDLSVVPIKGGGNAVYGYPEDPTPTWAKNILGGFDKNAKKEQAYGMGTVAPWLANRVGALQGAQDIAQTNFANMIGQTAQGIAGMANQVGPGAQFAPGAQAPFASRNDTNEAVNNAQAQAATAGGAYQAAVDQLQTSNLGQSLQAGLAQQIAAIPGKWDQQKLQFQQQLAPVLAQIESSRQQGEFARRQAIEQRRQFNKQNAVEAQIAGINAEADVAQAEIEANAAAAQDQADQAAEQYRSVSQIRGDLNKGDILLDNKGTGWGGRPNITKYHGKRVQWEQAQNGNWYGIARAGSGSAGGSSSSGGAPDSIYRSSTTKKRLTDELRTRWYGDSDPAALGGQNQGEPAWKDLKVEGVADAAARRLALWAIGNRQFLQRGKKLQDKDLRAFFQSVIPEVDYSRIRYYIDRLG